MKVGSVNADEHKSLGGRYGVKGFPTIKIFGANKNKPDDYNGARTAQGMVDAALSAARSKVNAQLSGKSSSDSKVNILLLLIYQISKLNIYIFRAIPKM